MMPSFVCTCGARQAIVGGTAFTAEMRGRLEAAHTGHGHALREVGAAPDRPARPPDAAVTLWVGDTGRPDAALRDAMQAVADALWPGTVVLVGPAGEHVPERERYRRIEVWRDRQRGQTYMPSTVAAALGWAAEGVDVEEIGRRIGGRAAGRQIVVA